MMRGKYYKNFEENGVYIYVKGVVSGDGEGHAGAGVVIYDEDGDVLNEVSMPLENGIGRGEAEYLALSEGLYAAEEVGAEAVYIHGDSLQVYNQVLGRWRIKQRKFMPLYSDVCEQLSTFPSVQILLIPKWKNKAALKLANAAIDCQRNRKDVPRHQKIRVQKETCTICLDEINMSEMFGIPSCKHRFCKHCMQKHVEARMRNGLLPECPVEECKSCLTVDDCKKFLSEKWLEILKVRVLEAQIPAQDKVYCPFNKCSALMSRLEIERINGQSTSSCPQKLSVRHAQCKNCRRFFCIECRIAWHFGFSCEEYQRRLLSSNNEDSKLHLLAQEKKWRQCSVCKSMIELAKGCNHMKCRCGHEFCYTCGAEWKDNRATCSCVLWNEDNILHEPLSDEEDSDDDDYDYDDDEIELLDFDIWDDFDMDYLYWLNFANEF